MQCLALPKLLPGGDLPSAACRAFSWKNEGKVRLKSPSPPAQSISRRVQPPHSFFEDPRIRNMQPTLYGHWLGLSFINPSVMSAMLSRPCNTSAQHYLRDGPRKHAA